MKKRGFGAGRWNGVGGKVEIGESIESAMIRESQEEIGVTPTIYKEAADLHLNVFFKEEPTMMNVTVYTATAWEGEPTESDEMAPTWFKKSNIPYDQMWSDDPYWLPDALDGYYVHAEFKLNERDEIIWHKVTRRGATHHPSV